MKNQVQLITYVDRLSAGGLNQLQEMLASGALQGLFGGAHLLPFFYPIDRSDAGFDPIDHTMVDPQLGDWNDIKALSGSVELMADLIVNHMSGESPQFQDFHDHGSRSRYAGLFLTFHSVFPNGATEADLLRIYRPRPGLPFLSATLATGEHRLLWTTFTSKQIDIDVRHPEGAAYLDSILAKFQASGVKAIRTVEATVSDLNLPGKIIDTAIQAGANRVDSLRFSIKDDQPLRIQALRSAALQARAHADAIALGLGVRLGSVLGAAEGFSVGIVVADRSTLGATAAAPTPVQPGSIDVTATVTLEIEIAQ